MNNHCKAFISSCLLFSISVLTGCSEQTDSVASYSEPVYSKQYRAASLTVILSLSETNIPSSGIITAMVEVHTPDGVEPDIPTIGSYIEPFTIYDGYTEPAQTLPNGKQLYRRVWKLQPALPGSTIFQPLVISAGADSVETDPIAIGVTSILPEGTDELTIRDIAEPVEQLPAQEKKRRSLYTAMGVLIVLSLFPFIIFLLRKPKVQPAILPHETALNALDNLPADEVKRIHELNLIFRVYYEARYRIPMVGKTAVELSVVLDDTRSLHFLERCDGIRFSNKVPEGFAEEAEQFVRTFVMDTMEVSE